MLTDAEWRALVMDDYHMDDLARFYEAVQEAEYAEQQIANMEAEPTMETWIYNY